MFPLTDAGYCPVKLGMMSSRLQSGVNTLQGFREDKRNQITLGKYCSSFSFCMLISQTHDYDDSSTTGWVFQNSKELMITFPTVSYINYGPYTSYAPTYDSSFGNISKEESDLIYSAFGDKSSLQGSDRYVQSQSRSLWHHRTFLADCSPDVSLHIQGIFPGGG